MTVQALFEGARTGNHVDLLALIMFLVFEKKVLQLDDQSDKLELYYLPKHRDRMNNELRAYKEKMNITYEPKVYEYKENYHKTYVLAVSKKQADFIAYREMVSADNVRICDPDELMHYKGTNIPLSSIAEGKHPGVLGGI